MSVSVFRNLLHWSLRAWAWHLSSAKLGIALAVIKSKPAGKSGRQHAEYLAAKVQQQEENWKTKAEELKKEVLSLKQELLLNKLLSKQRNGAETARVQERLENRKNILLVHELLENHKIIPSVRERLENCKNILSVQERLENRKNIWRTARMLGDRLENICDNVVKLFSQDLPEAQLSENDSGCDTQTLSLTPDPADAVLSSAVVPPSSLQPSQASFHRDARDCVLSKHMRFLQNLCMLRGSAKNPQTDGGDAVLEATALNMIESLVEAHREAGGGSFSGDVSQLDCFVQASRLVAQALERGVGRRTVLEKAEELLAELLELLLNNSQLNKGSVL
ncbi:hypothetical protein QTP86_029694 [Hemibagrus guttatus]|nr:hypothetical protein QTP86_029694 [Hemibagrus guttatus]